MEVTKAEKTVTPVSTTPIRRRSSLSIKLGMEKKEVQKIETTNEIDLPKDEFKQLHVDTFWKEYLLELKKSGDFAAFNALNHVKVELKENFTLLFQVTSNATLEEFNGKRNPIGRKFKDSLNNQFIQLETEIVEINEDKVLYSPEEKYKFLVKKNPNLEILRGNLGLDIYG